MTKKTGPDITGVLSLWNSFSKFPGGKWLFSKMVGMMIPYTGSVKPRILSLTPGEASVILRDRRSVRNHLDCIHAIALTNVGELTSGLAMTSALPRGSRAILKSLSIEYFKKARGTIQAKAKATLPVLSEKVDVPVAVDLFDSSGEKVAAFRANWQVGVPKQ